MSDEIYVFTSNGNDSLCDGKEAEYVGGPPDRPHPNCDCKIEEKHRERGCISIDLELEGVEADEPEPSDDTEPDPPVPTPGPDDPNNPRLVIPAPPDLWVQPPRGWQNFDACCTYSYKITCENGYYESGQIEVCAPVEGGLESYNEWENIYCTFVLDHAEAMAWAIAEAIADAVESKDECRCAMSS